MVYGKKRTNSGPLRESADKHSIYTLAETRGFESVWVAETRLTRDGITPCAAIAMATTRLKIAMAIVNVYTRKAVLTAVSFVSLDEVSQGRIIMGLGTGSPLVLKPQGVAFHKPLTRLRETIDVVQGEVVTFAGETIQVTEAKLEIPHSAAISPSILA